MMNYVIYSTIAAFGWAFASLIDRKAIENVNSYTMATLRTIVMGLSALLVLFIIKYKKIFNIKNTVTKSGYNVYKLIIVSGLLSFFVGHIMYYKALNDSPSSLILITLISFALPVVIVSILSVCIYGDRLNYKMILGILLSILGISMTIIYNPN